MPTIYHIGYAGLNIDRFIELLKENSIEVLVDVRSFPTSKNPDFKRESLKANLEIHGLKYVWLGNLLGGYRKGGYEEYMKTKSFKEGLEKLIELSKNFKSCILCLEKYQKHCHRRYIIRELERMGYEVIDVRAGKIDKLNLKET